MTATQPSLPISSPIHAASVPSKSDTELLIDNPAAKAEEELERALDALVAIGALHPLNRLTVEELVDSPMESVNDYNLTDEDIYEAVMEARKEREIQVDAENKLSLDEDVEDGESSDAGGVIPTRSEVLQAVRVLQEYAEPMDTPYFRELKAMLGKFERDIRALEMQRMKDTRIGRRHAWNSVDYSGRLLAEAKIL